MTDVSGRAGPWARAVASVVALAALGACGTTYQVPIPVDAQLTQARSIFAEEQSPATARFAQSPSGGLSLSQYERVISRVEPVAEEFCRTQTADREAFDCDVLIAVDTEMRSRNAFQTYIEGRPVVAFTLPLIADVRNEDELAFVLGHEFGHHIGEHIKKQEQQAMAGALILGALTGLAQAQATAGNPYRSTAYDRQTMERAMDAGAAIGTRAYSQTYELESDVLGTYIATMAGYDPVKGARYFARPEPARTPEGALSFWGTHPPDEKRLATVLATVAQIGGGSGGH